MRGSLSVQIIEAVGRGTQRLIVALFFGSISLYLLVKLIKLDCFELYSDLSNLDEDYWSLSTHYFAIFHYYYLIVSKGAVCLSISVFSIERYLLLLNYLNPDNLPLMYFSKRLKKELNILPLIEVAVSVFSSSLVFFFLGDSIVMFCEFYKDLIFELLEIPVYYERSWYYEKSKTIGALKYFDYEHLSLLFYSTIFFLAILPRNLDDFKEDFKYIRKSLFRK